MVYMLTYRVCLNNNICVILRLSNSSIDTINMFINYWVTLIISGDISKKYIQLNIKADCYLC